MITSARIVGFDKASELLAIEYDVAPARLSAVALIARVPAADAELLTSYPLTEAQVRQIADVAHISLQPGAYDYYFEGHEALAGCAT